MSDSLCMKTDFGKTVGHAFSALSGYGKTVRKSDYLITDSLRKNSL